MLKKKIQAMKRVLFFFNLNSRGRSKDHPHIYSIKRRALFVASLLYLNLDCVDSAKQGILESVAGLGSKEFTVTGR